MKSYSIFKQLSYLLFNNAISHVYLIIFALMNNFQACEVRLLENNISFLSDGYNRLFDKISSFLLYK